MKILNRAALLAAILTCAAGSAGAADGKASESAGGGLKDAGAPTTSMGAGGLTGTGATRDGARTGADDSKAQTGGTKPSAAPAAGTTR